MPLLSVLQLQGKKKNPECHSVTKEGPGKEKEKEICKIRPLIIGLLCTHELLLLCIDSSVGLNGFCSVF